MLCLVVREQEKMEDEVDIGIVPSQGLVPPTIHVRDLVSGETSGTGPDHSSAVPATKCSCQDMTLISQQVNTEVRLKMV